MLAARALRAVPAPIVPTEGDLDDMGPFFERYWEFFRQFRPRWSEADMGGRVGFSVLSLWLLCVGVAVWMAIGQPSGWLTYPATAVLWTVGGFYFVILGIPILILPFYALWMVIHPNRDESEFEREFDREREKLYEERAKKADELKEQGVLDEDFEMPPKHRPKFSRYPKSNLPPLPIQSAGVILIVALFLSGRLILASVYLIPAVAWLTLEGLFWLLQAWRSR
jgi:hypothetical protein